MRYAKENGARTVGITDSQHRHCEQIVPHPPLLKLELERGAKHPGSREHEQPQQGQLARQNHRRLVR